MRNPNLKAMQVSPAVDKDRKMVVVRPGDTNLGRLASAAGYKLRGKSDYVNMGTRGTK
jgi:ribosomal protein L13